MGGNHIRFLFVVFSFTYRIIPTLQAQDTMPPEIYECKAPRSVTPMNEVEVEARIRYEESGIEDVRILARVYGDSFYVQSHMTAVEELGSSYFDGWIYSDVVRKPGVEFYISASDSAGNVSYYPTEAPDSVLFIDVNQAEGWPQTRGGSMYATPAVGDVDGDGHLDVVAASTNCTVYVWDGSGDLLPGWPKSTGTKWLYSVALGRVSNNRTPDIVACSMDGSVHIWNSNGDPLPGWPVSIGDCGVAAPALGDIDGDGRSDIVAQASDGKVYAWDYEGVLLEGWPVTVGDERPWYWCYNSSPAIGDVDGDGRCEIVVSYSSTTQLTVTAFDFRGSVVFSRLFGSLYDNIVSPVLADLNEDGVPEIVVAVMGESYVMEEGNVVLSVLDGAGNDRAGWPRYTEEVAWASLQIYDPVVGDIDGDGWSEIVLNTLSCLHGDFPHVPFYDILVWSSDGEFSSPWTTSTGCYHGLRTTCEGPNGVLALTDMDGSPDSLEFLGMIGHPSGKNPCNSFYYYIYASDPILTEPMVADLDEDGKLELIGGSLKGRLYVWDLDGVPSDNRLEWGMYRHDLWHTGQYGFVPPEYTGIEDGHHRSIPDKGRLCQNYPNPFNTETTIGYELQARSQIELSISNVLGGTVRVLLSDVQDPGIYYVKWDCRDGSEKIVGSGVYFSILKTESFTVCRKMVLLR